jgi:hypothetical protein
MSLEADFFDQVVGDFSSSLDYAKEWIDIINANHVDMCRFSGINDNGYCKIKSVVSKCLEPPKLKSRQPSCKPSVAPCLT